MADPLETSARTLDALRARMGREPDGVIAEAAGVSRAAVVAYRYAHGIGAYDQHLARDDRADRADAARMSSARKSPGRKSTLDRFAAYIGVETDASVADRAGLTSAAVAAWRRKRGVPAAPRGVWVQTRPPEVRVPPTPARAPERPPAPSPVRTPAPAPAPAPVARTVPRADASAPLHAYTLVASGRDGQRTFYVVGEDMAAACGLAERALALRPDGPWLVDRVERTGDALG